MSGWAADILDVGRPIESTVWNLGQMVIILNDFPDRQVVRSPAQARNDQLDHYQVHLPLAESAVRLRLEGDGSELAVPTGAPILMDLSRPYAMRQGAGRTVQAYMPREVLEEMLPGPRDLHGLRLNGAVGSLLAELLGSLVRRLPEMNAEATADTAKATMHLVAASIAPLGESMERARPAMQASLRRQACRFIEMHLQDPDLSVDRACAALRISRASLYRLLEPYGGFANHVTERRLLRIHGLIATRPQRTSLARLAEDHGFNSAAQFSRAFRRHFGYSPSEATASLPAVATLPSIKQENAVYSLIDWLRPLRG